MADYMTLMGAEDVRRAGYAMSEAGTSMLRASGNIDDALHRHRQFMDDWLQRFEAALQTLKETDHASP